MVKILAILSAVILLISAFVADRNKTAFQSAVEERERAESYSATLTGQLSELQEEVRSARDEIEASETELVERREAVAAQVTKNEELVAEVARKRDQMEAQQAQVAQAEEEIGNREELRELTAKLKSQRVELEELAVDLDANQSHLNNLTSEANRIESIAADLRERTSWPTKRISNPNLRTTVRSVYPTWGFVTLNAGDDAGVVAGSTLEVRRGGEPVANLLVTAVEGTTAAADIVPDETDDRQGTVHPGDLVVAAPASSSGSDNLPSPSATTQTTIAPSSATTAAEETADSEVEGAASMDAEEVEDNAEGEDVDDANGADAPMEEADPFATPGTDTDDLEN